MSRTTPITDNRQKLVSVVSFFLIVVLWLGTRPYYGLVHDSRFYMVEALRSLDPSSFAQDLYFRFGSQDKFTLFSKLYAPIVSALGISSAALAATVLGEALWIGGLLYFARTLFGKTRLSWLSVSAVVVLPSIYTTFSYGEPFVTPRLYAEALTLFAFGFLFCDRIGAALAILMFSAVLHPLVALPGIVSVLLYRAATRPIWWIFITAICGGIAALAFVGVQPFGNLLRQYDPTWFKIISVRDSMCLVTRWPMEAILRVMEATALCSLATILASQNQRRFLMCILAVGLGGILCAFIGGDLLHNVFLIQIQPWRSAWLLMLTANLYFVPVLLRVSQGCKGVGLVTETVGFSGVLLLISKFIPPIIFISVPTVILVVGIASWHLFAGRRGETISRAICLVVIALACVGTILFAYRFVAGGFAVLWPEQLRPGLYSFALVLLALGFMLSRARLSGRSLVAGTMVLLAFAAYGWDAQTPWTRFVDSSDPIPSALASIMPMDGSVYWEGGLELLWFKFRRADYFSCGQGTGALFFRSTALEYERRAASFWRLRTLDFSGANYLCPHRSHKIEVARTRKRLGSVCSREPGLDEVVLVRPVRGATAKIWVSPVPFTRVFASDGKREMFKTNHFYFYSCSQFR